MALCALFSREYFATYIGDMSVMRLESAADEAAARTLEDADFSTHTHTHIARQAQPRCRDERAGMAIDWLIDWFPTSRAILLCHHLHSSCLPLPTYTHIHAYHHHRTIPSSFLIDSSHWYIPYSMRVHGCIGSTKFRIFQTIFWNKRKISAKRKKFMANSIDSFELPIDFVRSEFTNIRQIFLRPYGNFWSTQ